MNLEFKFVSDFVFRASIFKNHLLSDSLHLLLHIALQQKRFMAADNARRQKDDGFRPLDSIRIVFEQMTDDRNITQYRNFIDGLRLDIFDHAGNDDRCAVFDQNARFGVGRFNDRHPLVGCFRREKAGDGADLRLDQHADVAVLINGRCDVEFDPDIDKGKLARCGCGGGSRGRGCLRIRLFRDNVDGGLLAFFGRDVRVREDLGLPDGRERL